MKQLRFASELVELIVTGQKKSTWRLWDDKNLQVGDAVNFSENDKNEPFARGKITKIIEKPFSFLTDQDKSGHETFKNDQQMYKTYEQYYQRPVDGQTIVWFEIMK